MAAYVRNVKPLIKKLKTLPQKVENKVCKKASRNAAKVQQKEAKQRFPKRTGDARAAIKVRAMKRKKGRIGANVIISTAEGSAGFYAKFVELGTENQEAQETIKEAAEATQEKAADMMTKELADGIEREAKK